MRERIATGKLFTDYCEGLPEDRLQAKKRMMAFNATGTGCYRGARSADERNIR